MFADPEAIEMEEMEEWEALEALDEMGDMEEWEALDEYGDPEEWEALDEYGDMEEWEALDEYGDMEEWEALEEFGDLEEWEEEFDYERPTPAVRTRRRVVTMPPVVVRGRSPWRKFPPLDRFLFNRYTLRRFHIPRIRRLALLLNRLSRGGRRRVWVQLVGHTDSRGSAAFNARLGMRRAAAVRRQLVLALNRIRPGLAARIRITHKSLGEKRPIASNRTNAGRARNRRVEIFYRTVGRGPVRRPKRPRRPRRPGC